MVRGKSEDTKGDTGHFFPLFCVSFLSLLRLRHFFLFLSFFGFSFAKEKDKIEIFSKTLNSYTVSFIGKKVLKQF